MTRIDAIREELRMGKRIKVLQELDEQVARRQWEEAVKRREATEARLEGLLKELQELRRQTQVATP